MSVFGTIITGGDVEQAAIAWLKWWLPTYLREMERITSRPVGVLESPFSWSTSNRFDRRPDRQLPAAVVISPGLAGKPARAGDGSISAWWRIGIAIIVRGADQEDANEIVKLYGAAIRTLAVQRPAFSSDVHPDGFANGCELVDESYDDVPTNYLPVGASVEVDLNVQVGGISHALAGPSAPAPDPVDWPTVASADDVHITLEKETIT
jgi:hypothetical protein